MEITAGNGGNANYSKQYIDPATVPSNIVAYIPITLTANPAGGTTPYSYQWYLGAGCFPYRLALNVIMRGYVVFCVSP